ncbi:helix-turn-helix transcriptional regulator [Hungatella hathewayi]|uniref:helix-turn-helix transcriptional regulator n=1 Tax=Hungatella hathewayi TaxID=154046 RepID=UPI0026DCC3DA|nr:AraC family transcriptional regulator [Hungatella hathewayi]
MRILEYKHVYGHANILTFEQIRSVDAVTYSYPLSMENRLVHCIVEGKEEALQIFDQLIRTNLADKTLSIESIQSFVYVLIGTLGRVFQELKTSPEALLKEDLNFKYLYEHWNDSVTITTLRHAIQDILTAVNCRGETNDEKLLNEMIHYIHTNYTDDIMLNDMADQFNISPKYCGILFKQLSGQNFKDYLNRYRIEKAKELLQQKPGIKIAEVSLMVGFNSANSFIRVFGKYTGVTPKAYMESLKEDLPLP